MKTVTQERMIEVQLVDADQLTAAANVIGAAISEKQTISASEAEMMIRFRTSQSEEELAQLLASPRTRDPAARRYAGR